MDHDHEIVGIVTSNASPEYEHKVTDFSEYACRFNIPFHKTTSLSSIASEISSYEADIAVSVNFPVVISQAFIDIFPLGILNAHGGDLPRYRGNACQAWAILNGEERIGLCIHKMIGRELDSGDIIARDYLLIDHTTKVTHICEWMLLQTPELMLKALKLLSADPTYVLEQQSKNSKHALRCYPRRPEDGLINWAVPAIDVLRLINASNKPYSGAFCFFEGDKIVIWDAQINADEEVFCAVPGQVVKIDDGSVIIACGIGKIEVFEVEYQGFSGNPRKVITSIRQRLT